MTMLLQNLQEEQQELRKVQATTLDIIGQQIGRSMPASSTPKRQPPRVRCGTCDACTQDCRPGARRPNCARWGSAPGTPATSAPSTPARKRGPDGKFIGEGGRVLSPQREKDMAKSILAEQAARAKRKKRSPSPTRGPALGGDKNRPGDGSGDGGEAMAEADPIPCPSLVPHPYVLHAGFTAELEREVVAASTGSMQQWEDPEAVSHSVSENEDPAPEPVPSAAAPEDRLSAALHALSFSIDGLAMAIGSSCMGRPASVAAEMQGVWAVPGDRQRGAIARRFLPRTPAKREEEEFNIDALLASPVPAKKKSKKRRKLPPDLSSDRHKGSRNHVGEFGCANASACIVWQMASPSSSGKYDTVIKSGLKLKGGDKSREVGVKAAKKKKKSQEDILTEQLQASAEQELQEQSELVKGATQGPTTAQKTFQLAREKRTNQRVNEAIQFTHRQRMDKLNAHLGSLSEHFDIPKVGPG
ncbi:Uncharacterized protein C31G5.21 [Symbiodinium microadriaticum]|uniref:Uncharacterized protein C31G5.21 n=1 Tax=Symbiodinium microadriaticum TaxID=2951 RepID=A0A1Q9DG85_SYMMI|nr:Uncharacterized protein C31G5.21 [Symbiodinium microadriaticum]